jgi:hypothetical protein
VLGSQVISVSGGTLPNGHLGPNLSRPLSCPAENNLDLYKQALVKSSPVYRRWDFPSGFQTARVRQKSNGLVTHGRDSVTRYLELLRPLPESPKIAQPITRSYSWEERFFNQMTRPTNADSTKSSTRTRPTNASFFPGKWVRNDPNQ